MTSTRPLSGVADVREYTPYDLVLSTPFIESPASDLTRSIAELFEQQVALSPAGLALKYRDRLLTYQQLNVAANRIGHGVREASRQRSEPIALLLADRAQSIIGMLGVLKAGQIVVRLDPVAPIARLQHIIEDSGARVLLTDAETFEIAGQLSQSVDQIIRFEELDRSSVENLNATIDANLPAFIHFTSGSTGRPKGVFRSYRHILESMLKRRNRLHLNNRDRVLALSSPAFASWTSHVLSPLLSGAALLVYDINRDRLADLGGLMLREGVTFYHSAPSVFRNFAATLTSDARFPQVRLFSLGSEPILRKDFELYRQLFADTCPMRVGYASTEAGGISEYWLDKNSRVDSRVVPVGYIYSNVEVTIVDEHDQPVGFDAVGEIVVKGANVAAGYWRKPDLQSAAFQSDPIDSRKQIFHTGDLGRLRPDGLLEHLGRKDFQVKIRGNRVETSEIEMALLEIDSIRAAFVTALENSADEKYLAAYVVPIDPAAFSARHVRQQLTNKLPAYMIPAVFVKMAALPLNTSGKIDRQALPEPDRAGEQSGDAILPRDDIERQLAKIWTETLRLSSIDVRADFFDLGGDSLLAARIFAEIDRQFGKRLSPTLLLNAPTIEQLALIVRSDKAASPSSTLVAIQPLGSKPLLFLTHGIGGGVLDYTPLTRHLGTDQPVYGLVAIGLDGSEPQLTDLHAMAMRYVQEVLTLQPRGPYSIGGYSYGGAVALEVAQQLILAGHEVKLLAMFDYGAPHANYHRAQWNKQFSSGFIQNLPHWLGQFLRLGPRGMFARVRRKTRLAWRRLRGMEQPYSDIADIMDDISNISPEHRAFMANQSQALRAYTPRSYPGRVTVFRTRAQSLVCSFDPRMKWDTLAGDRVDVRIVEGSHHNMLQEPYVRSLAAQLKNSLV